MYYWRVIFRLRHLEVYGPKMGTRYLPLIGGSSINSSEMTPEERQKEELNTGPLSVLTQSVKNSIQVRINCANKKKFLGEDL